MSAVKPKPKLDIDLSREQLTALGLVHAAEALDDTLSNAVKQSVTAHAFLDQLLRAELDEREQRRIKACETLLIQGPPGVGKNHLAVSLGIKAIEQGFSAQFYRFDELLVALRADASIPPSLLRRKNYLSTSLLIIDELGFEPMNREAASLFFRLVSYRYGRGSILITTNKSVRDWTELLAGDEALTTAILDRLLHNAHVFNIKGRSYGHARQIPEETPPAERSVR